MINKTKHLIAWSKNTKEGKNKKLERHGPDNKETILKNNIGNIIKISLSPIHLVQRPDGLLMKL
jgi:hypothetical protein